ncbi:DNA-binding protein [Brachybacterium alimentarium]|nr:DNA-binding protein [Brachybacterium alimentarium]
MSSASSARAGSPPEMLNSPALPPTQHASGRTLVALPFDSTRKERTMEKLCFTADEVADRLSVSKTRVYDLMRCGELPSVKLGRSRLVKAADLLAYVESLEPAPVVA